MSIEQCVESLYGDTWTDEQKAEEVQRIKEEDGTIQADEPKTYDGEEDNLEDGGVDGEEE